MYRRRSRLRFFSYTGYHRYLLTVCTFTRQPVFTQPAVVEATCTTLLQTSTACDFEVLAYCFMPDHLHFLVSGVSEHADLKRLVHLFKQRSAFDYSRATGQRLWQVSYHDRVLRSDEASTMVVAYMLENPLRSGLVGHVEDYPFIGSGICGRDELFETVQFARHGRKGSGSRQP